MKFHRKFRSAALRQLKNSKLETQNCQITRRTICPFTRTFPCPLPICAWAARKISLAAMITRRRRASSTLRIITFRPGKKQWTWGNHEFGYAWDRNLTDADARGEFPPYIEIMAGVLRTTSRISVFCSPAKFKTERHQDWHAAPADFDRIPILAPRFVSPGCRKLNSGWLSV